MPLSEFCLVTVNLLGEMWWLCIAAGRCCSKLMSVLMEGSSFFCE